MTWRPWRVTVAPILISFSRRLVSDHGSAAFGIASVRMKLPRLTAPSLVLTMTAIGTTRTKLTAGFRSAFMRSAESAREGGYCAAEIVEAARNRGRQEAMRHRQ
jgi:hypothetical protein